MPILTILVAIWQATVFASFKIAMSKKWWIHQTRWKVSYKAGEMTIHGCHESPAQVFFKPTCNDSTNRNFVCKYYWMAWWRAKHKLQIARVLGADYRTFCTLVLGQGFVALKQSIPVTKMNESIKRFGWTLIQISTFEYARKMSLSPLSCDEAFVVLKKANKQDKAMLWV